MTTGRTRVAFAAAAVLLLAFACVESKGPGFDALRGGYADDESSVGGNGRFDSGLPPIDSGKSDSAGLCGTIQERCTSSSECCNGICDLGRCSCHQPGHRCSTNQECCSGSTCENNVCRELCRDLTRDCTDGDQCCSGVCSAGKCGVSAGAGRELARGTNTLVAAFVDPSGIIIVDSIGISKVSHGGSLIMRGPAEGEITAAAFDGTYLVVAEAGRLATYTPNFDLVAADVLTEVCASGVLVSGGRFVCGTDSDWQRIFYTYDVTTAELVAQSAPYTYYGLPMIKVPGSDEFVTVSTDSFPSDYHLYSVAPSGEAVFVNESPYHGELVASLVAGFIGAPATHLITEEGLFLSLREAGCVTGRSSFTSECFLKDGELGTLLGGERFVALDARNTDKLYGVVGRVDAYYPCHDGCRVQRVDLASRTVEAELSYELSIGRVVAAEHDVQTDSLMLAYEMHPDTADPFGQSPGYGVVLLDYD